MTSYRKLRNLPWDSPLQCWYHTAPDSIGTERRVLADSRVYGEIQAILLDNPSVTLQTITTLNPATLLPDTEEDSALHHECLEMIVQVYSSRPDQLDPPLAAPDWEL